METDAWFLNLVFLTFYEIMFGQFDIKRNILLLVSAIV